VTHALMFLALTAAPADAPAPVATRVADFTRTDAATGKAWALAEQTRDAKATVVLFFHTGCPVATAYVPKLLEMHRRYAKEGVTFVAVNSMSSDTLADVAAQVKEFKLTFPVLKDDGTTLADKFAVERVPTAFVLDAGKTVRYAGRIDDQFAPGVHKPAASTRELGRAIDAVLEGREVKVSHAPVAGCKLSREKAKVAAAPTVNYHAHVARIVQAKCQECHRPGEAGPFALMTYKQTKAWADMIREVVADDVMPPWHADAPRGHFANDRRLTADEKKTLLAWVDQGCAEGDPKDGPEPRKYLDGWRLSRAPDEVIKMRDPIDVPAQTLFKGMPYSYVEAGERFKEDKWVTGIEVRPEYRAVVHHIIVFIVPPGKSFFDLDLGNFGQYILGGYVPGDAPIYAPANAARKIAKGSQLLFEVHYTPNGRPGRDQSMVGLLYAKDAPKIEIDSKAVMNTKFQIPAGDGNHEVKSYHRCEKETTIYGMTPHMHVRGKAFKFELVSTDGSREVLLNVPKYDFNWQATYTLSKPRVVPAGSTIECTAWYDNSEKNLVNPDPTKRVRWGNQTWEEMMIGFLEFSEK
jgi:thiol-disulfide isomerase/thioredoxin